MGEHKKIPDTELAGQMGVNLIESVVLEMGFLWHPAGPFDAGIDGRIELRDTARGEPLNRFVGVQSKAWASYTAEDEDGFQFLCERADIRYWMQSSDPVLLVCSHPDTGDVWFKCVTDWFGDPERRASRRVLFDKSADRFDAQRAVDLLGLATRHEPVLHRRPPAPPEQLVTNLIPILEHGAYVWSAPTALSDHTDVRTRYEEVGGERASDYLIRESTLFSLRDPSTCPLRHLLADGAITRVPADEWAYGDDPRRARYWVELLRRSLLQQVKSQLRWHPKKRLFYYGAPDPLTDLSIQGPNGPRQVVKVEYYFDKRRNESRLKYVRHHAFRPGFVLVDGRWHLEVEPDYLFTWDGERDNYRADEYMAGIKRLDRNSAVVGQLRMWEYLLTQPPSLLRDEPPLLTFGPLQLVEAPVGIDDDAWRGKASGPTGIDGQEELAA